MKLYTVGHSTRTAAEFLELLQRSGVELLVDVRRYAASRRHPHFSAPELGCSLGAAGIEYIHEPALGGRRKARKDSPNTAWRTSGFRGYADYAGTELFRTALERLIEAARNRTAAIMCAEAVPWRCHRQLIADQLCVRGITVLHIIGPGKVEPHRLNPMARVLPGPQLVYPAPQLSMPDLA
ncbi:MAG: hypothetical protein KatS3mg081_2680 [Gemmatimonadales bacterium]|nr:hypothetical protein HRbin33_01689 [bacterium HR33]GIW53325.1 MAG: hypothetical protein KatS3mg081_2680 [Gemmatimonadales bacterium]